MSWGEGRGGRGGKIRGGRCYWVSGEESGGGLGRGRKGGGKKGGAMIFFIKIYYIYLL